MNLVTKYNFKNGKDLSKNEIRRMKKEAYDIVKKSKSSVTIRCGNTIVVGTYNLEEKQVEIVVAKKYKIYNYV